MYNIIYKVEVIFSPYKFCLSKGSTKMIFNDMYIFLFLYVRGLLEL